MGKGIKLTAENDLMIVNKSLFVGDTYMQEVGVLLQLNQGELKSDALIGGNLTKHIRGTKDQDKIKSHLQVQFELDGKDYDDIKEKIQL